MARIVMPLTLAVVFVIGCFQPAEAQRASGARSAVPGIHEGATTWFRSCAACPLMVSVPSGRFIMGPPVDVAYGEETGPSRPARVRIPFAVGVHAVTVGEFRVFVAETGYRVAGGCAVDDPDTSHPDPPKESRPRSWRDPGFEQNDRHPVVCVSWRDARAYVTWLSRKAGQRYRLPSEVEWEYAARAGSTGPFHFGSTLTGEDANYDTRHGYNLDARRLGLPPPPPGKGVFRRKTVPVGSFRPNAFGLYDVHGNVWEWTDRCSLYPVARDGQGSRVDWSRCEERVVRGGSWRTGGNHLVSNARMRVPSNVRANDIGFRVVMTTHTLARSRVR